MKAQLAKCAKELSGQLDERSRQSSIRRRDKKPPSGRSVSVDRGYLTKASEIHTGASYRHSPTTTNGAPARSSNMTSQQLNVNNFNGHQYTLNSHLNSVHQQAIEDTRSFIQERIERLYGPQALAAGFIRKSPGFGTRNGHDTMGNSLKKKSSKKERVIPIQLEGEDQVDEAPPKSSMPSVFRHLRPEFRHQLPVKSSVKSPINETAETKEVIIPVVTESTESDNVSSIEKVHPETKVNVSDRLNGETPKQNGFTSSVLKTGNNRISPVEDTRTNEVILPTTTSVQNVDSSVNSSSNQPHQEISEVGASSKVDVKDGHYFLKIVDEVVRRLEAEATYLENELDKNTENISEEIRGKILASTGKTRLLISQKIKQFCGLCHKNITGEKTDDEFPTTTGDLAGFWDMVSLQVEDVEKMMANSRAIVANGWKEVEVEPKPSSAKPASGRVTRRVKPASAVQSAASKERDAARKKAMEERKKAMREAMKAKKAAVTTAGCEDSVQIFAPAK